MLLLFSANSGLAQDVLDSPFYIENVEFTDHEPANLFNACVSAASNGEAYDKAARLHPYPLSYVSGDHRYHSMRVMSYIGLDENPHLNFQSQDHPELEPAYTGHNINLPEGYTLNTQMLAGQRDYLDVNVDSMLHSNVQSFDYSSSGFVQRLRDEIDANGPAAAFIGVNEHGRFVQTNPYVPDFIQFKSFVEILVNGLFYDGALSGYTSNDFRKRLDFSKIKEQFHSPQFIFKQVHGFRIKEDYFINPFTGKFTRKIIGLALVGEDQTLGNELIWFYYPEVRWELEDRCTVIDGQIINLEYVLDEHLFDAEVESFQPMYPWARTADQYWILSLYAPTVIQLWRDRQRQSGEILDGKVDLARVGQLPNLVGKFKKGKANGDIAIRSNEKMPGVHGRMENGLEQGAFNYTNPLGTLIAVRNFSGGKLSGMQQNFHTNGNLYAEYQITNGEKTSLKRWHANGQLLESGSFKNGLVHGIWEYHLKLSDESLAELRLICPMIELPGQVVDGFYSLKLEYAHEVALDNGYLFGPRVRSKVIE